MRRIAGQRETPSSSVGERNGTDEVGRMKGGGEEAKSWLSLLSRIPRMSKASGQETKAKE